MGAQTYDGEPLIREVRDSDIKSYPCVANLINLKMLNGSSEAYAIDAVIGRKKIYTGSLFGNDAEILAGEIKNQINQRSLKVGLEDTEQRADTIDAALLSLMERLYGIPPNNSSIVGVIPLEEIIGDAHDIVQGYLKCIQKEISRGAYTHDITPFLQNTTRASRPLPAD